jgi:hypothetical protein
MAKEKAEKKSAEPKKKEAAEAKADKQVEAKADAGHDSKAEKGHGHGKEKKHHEPKPAKPEHKAWHARSKPREELHCKVKSCKRRYRAKGYCVSHYREWRHGKFGKQRYTACMANNCFKPMATSRQGLCDEHWIAVYKKGESVSAKVAEAPAKDEAKKESAA